MDYSEWDAYPAETNLDTPHQSSESALIGSSTLKFGRNTIIGLVLIVLSLLLNFGYIIFPLTIDSTNIDNLTFTITIMQRMTFVGLFFQLIGVILILSDVNKLVEDINHNRKQQNYNLALLAQKINKK